MFIREDYYSMLLLLLMEYYFSVKGICNQILQLSLQVRINVLLINLVIVCLNETIISCYMYVVCSLGKIRASITMLVLCSNCGLFYYI